MPPLPAPPVAASSLPRDLIQGPAQRARPPVRVLEEIALAPARLHEFCGPARRTLVMALARALPGSIFWIRPAWLAEDLNPDGMRPLIDPARLTTVSARRAEDLLWSMEEILRSGAVPLVVADLPEPPGLTPVRRLHLAAETGAAEGDFAPLGVILTPGAGGAPGVESRWHLAPRHRAGRTRWQLERRRARQAGPRSWVLRLRKGQFDLQPPPPETDPAAPPGAEPAGPQPAAGRPAQPARDTAPAP